MHEFENIKAEISREEERYTATCQCGWVSESKGTREEAIIAFENHVHSDSKHVLKEGKQGPNFKSLLIALLGITYILSPWDFVPDWLIGVGWIEDILIAIFCIFLLKGGLKGKAPGQIISNVFK